MADDRVNDYSSGAGIGASIGSAIAPGVGTFVGAGLGALGSLAVNDYMQRRTAEYNQRMAEKNTELNYRLNQLSQQNAAVNEVYGLRQAGLSPTLANGAQGMSVSSGSAGTAQAPQMAISDMLWLSQLDKLQADTARIEAETESTKLKNDQTKAKNAVTGEMMRNMAHDLINKPYVRNFPEVFQFFTRMEKDQGLNAGSLEAFASVVSQMGANAETTTKILREQFNQASEGYKQEFRLNEAQIDKLFEETVNLTQQMGVINATEASIRAGTELTDAQKTQVDAATKQINESINQIKAMTDKINAYNLPKAIDKATNKGEWSQLFACILGLIIEGAARQGFK